MKIHSAILCFVVKIQTMASQINIPQSTHEQVFHLMSNLAERVINNPPTDIHLFAQNFFEELLFKRDGQQSRNYEKLPNCAKLIKNSSKGFKFQKIDIIKTKRIDYTKYYRKQSQEEKHKKINKDKKEVIQNQKHIADVKKHQENITFQIIFKSHLRQYRCLHSSFETISEDDEGLEIQENICKKQTPKKNQDFQPLSRKSQKFFVVSQLIKISMPRICFPFSDIAKVKYFDKVNLIVCHNLIKKYCVKVTFLASNDYGIVFTVNCGRDSEVLIFLLRMPKDKLKAARIINFHKAIDFKENNIPNYKMDLYIFKGFLMKFQESFKYRLDCQAFKILNNKGRYEPLRFFKLRALL